MRTAAGIMNFDSAGRDRAAWLVGGLFALASSASGFFLAVYFKETLRFTGRQIGLLFALQALCGLLAALPAGLINDRLSSRGLVALSLVVQAAALALMSLVDEFAGFVLVFFVWSLANGLFWTSLDVLVLKTDSGERTGLRLSWYQALRFLGLAAGYVLTGWLISGGNFRPVLQAVALACLLLLALVPALAPTRVRRQRLSDYRADVSDWKVVLFSLWLFLFTTHWGAEYTCYSLFLRRVLMLSWTGLGFYMAAEFAAIVITLVLCRNQLDRPERLRAMASLGLVASGSGLVGMIFRPLWLSVAFRMLHGAGDGLLMVIMYLGIARLFALERVGGNSGFVRTVTMLGMASGALVFGPLGEHLGYQVPLWSSGVLVLALALPLLKFSRVGNAGGSASLGGTHG